LMLLRKKSKLILTLRRSITISISKMKMKFRKPASYL
jgi:hypothetical protein